MNWLERVLISAAAAAVGAVTTLLWVAERPRDVPVVPAVAATSDGGRSGTAPAAAPDEALRARVALLERRVAAIAGARGADAADTTPAEQADPAPDTVGAGPAASIVAHGPGDGVPALLQAGVGPTIAERLQQRIGELEMARLYLRDRAMREGWIDSPEFTDALNALDSPGAMVRREFGDDVYDRFLFAQGHSNRVVIASALYDSPAAVAGIRSGDRVLRYADERVFSLRDLRTATAAGRAGEAVTVEVLRDGERIYTTVPRGPLGVRLDLTREPPPAG